MEVLGAIVGLVQHHAIPAESVVHLVDTIFRDLTVQSLSQPARQSTYEVLATLMTRHLVQLKSMGSRYIQGFVDAMDGEKDPRNLVLGFRMVRLILSDFPEHEGHAEDLFNVVSCYFPITFKPPPNDPHGITNQDLTTGNPPTWPSSN